LREKREKRREKREKRRAIPRQFIVTYRRGEAFG
jgi:hypothetical protein